MKLKELTQLFDCKCAANGETEITDITYDSRKVRPGSLFVAISGFETDGHTYIPAAVKAGAAAIIGEKAVECACPYIWVQSSRRALAIAAAQFYNHPEKKLKIIGITGTNGKTTTTYLIRQILALKGIRCDLIGTNQIIIGDTARDSVRTTPESLEIYKIFSEIEKSGGEYAVMEVSSHSLALDRVYGIPFETAVLTNITQDHLDFHKTMDNYADAKAKLFAMSKTAAVNIDSDYADLICGAAKGKLVTYSIDCPSDIRAQDLQMSERGVIFDVNDRGRITKMRLGIPGKFSVYNALAAMCACKNIGMDDEDIEKGLVLAKPVKGRIEVVHTGTPYTMIIDYAHTPDGLENIIRAVRAFAKGRVITLFGCGGDRDRTKRPIMGKIAEEMSDFVIVTSDNPRTEEPQAIIADILSGMKQGNHTVIENRRDAIAYATKTAAAGDVVILAGKGHETYQEIQKVKHDFDERVVIKEILRGEDGATNERMN